MNAIRQECVVERYRAGNSDDGSVGGRLIELFVRFARLPSLGPVRIDDETERRFVLTADRVLAGDGSELPEPRLDFLRWLAERGEVFFHGSPRRDLERLEPIRRSRDVSEFGNQQAIFASSDPVWALYFACLRRDNGFRDTRNGSIGRPGGPLYPRSYFFSHNRGAAPDRRFGPGYLYVLPGAPFRAEPPLFGALDTAQWAATETVTPLARIDVSPADFPFADRISFHRQREPLFFTLLRCGRGASRENR